MSNQPETPDPQPKKKQESKNSKTDSSKSFEDASKRFEEAVAELKAHMDTLIGKPVTDELKEEVVKHASDYILDALDDTDLAIIYDVKLVSKDKIEISVKGHAMLTGIMEPTAIAEAPEIFQGVFYNSVWQPLRLKMFRVLQGQAQTKRVLPALMGGLDRTDDIPRIPAPVQHPGMPMGE